MMEGMIETISLHTGQQHSLTPNQPPNLRGYQKNAIADLYKCIRQGAHKILFVAPTGAGKTIVMAKIIADAVSRQRRCLFLVHRDVLVQQTLDKLALFGVHPGVIKAGYKEDRAHLVQVASIQSLCRRDRPAAEIVFFDEAHLTAWSKIGQSILEDDDLIHIGVTATPWRLSKREGMNDLFDALVCAPMPHALIEQGYLVPCIYFGFPQKIDLSQVKTIAGDYSENELAIACDQPSLINKLVEEWQRICSGRRTIAFAVNVEHSQHICKAFLDAGVPAAHVDGNTPIRDRTQIYQQLASGEILVLSSCQALQEGFDVAEVSAILLCRPTQSKALYFQQVGRGLRIAPHIGKENCLVLDQAGNVSQFGFIEELKQIQFTYGQEDDQHNVAPKKECPGCGLLLSNFVRRCTFCGYEFSVSLDVPPEDCELLLSRGDQQKLQAYQSDLREAFYKEYAPGYACMRFKEKYGAYPPKEWSLAGVLGRNPAKEAIHAYAVYLWQIAQKKNKDSNWVKLWLGMELGSGRPDIQAIADQSWMDLRQMLNEGTQQR